MRAVVIFLFIGLFSVCDMLFGVQRIRSLQEEFAEYYDLSSYTGQKVGICAMTTEGEHYLDEWVDYNFAIGFHQINIYDNSDDNDLKEWGDRSQMMGRKVNVVHYPGNGKQNLAYDECTKTFGYQSDFLAYFDDDEFLVLKKHEDVAGLVRDHLPNGSLAIHWRIFGTSNHTLYSPLPVTRRYQYRLGDAFHLIKSIVRVQDYVRHRTVHSFHLKNGTFQRDTSGSTNFSDNFNKGIVVPTDVAVLHHYKYKSVKEYRLKSCKRGLGNVLRDTTKNCGQVPSVGDVFDDEAWQLLKTRVPKYAIFDNWTDYS